MMAQRSKPLQLRLLLQLILLIPAQSSFTLQHVALKYFIVKMILSRCSVHFAVLSCAIIYWGAATREHLVKWMPGSYSYSYTLNFVLPMVDIRDHPAHSFFVHLSLFLLSSSISQHLPVSSATDCNHPRWMWINRRHAACSTLLATETDSSHRPRYRLLSLIHTHTFTLE